MTCSTTRRDFLAAGAFGIAMLGTGGFVSLSDQVKRPIVRPPAAASPVSFSALCNRCQRCLQACPFALITPLSLEDGLVVCETPSLSFRNGYCNFCMQCVEVCPTGALSYENSPVKNIGVAVVVNDACIAWDWVGCSVCKDICPIEGAISLDGQGRPLVNSEYCNGCGRCEQGCPSASLRAYNSRVESKGIVVVPRTSEAAFANRALSTRKLAESRSVPAKEGQETSLQNGELDGVRAEATLP